MKEVNNIKNSLKNIEILHKEKIIQELKDFLIYSLKHTSETSNNLVYELIEILVDLEDLKYFVLDVDCIDWNLNKGSGFGAYFPYNLSIVIYLYNIIDDYREDYQNIEPYLKKLLFFSKIFVTCIHEVEHANQIKKCLENNGSLETLILRNSMNYLSKRDREIQLINKGYNAFELPALISRQRELEFTSEKFYYINPSERFAEGKSYYLTILIFSCFMEEYPYLKNDLLYCLYDALCEGYEDYKNPTETFIKAYDFKNDWDKISILTNNLNLYEKAFFGLELERKEKEKLKTKCNKYYHQ